MTGRMSHITINTPYPGAWRMFFNDELSKLNVPDLTYEIEDILDLGGNAIGITVIFPPTVPATNYLPDIALSISEIEVQMALRWIK